MCKAGVKNAFALLKHLDKNHELADVWCKDIVPHSRESLSPGRIDIVLKTGDGVTVNRLWDMERCSCLRCDSLHNRHYKVEIHPKVHKEMYANMKAL
jgi:hypothetical protein